MPASRVARRLLRAALLGVGAFAGLSVLLLLLFLIPGVREAIGRGAMRRLDAAVPGRLITERFAWPSPGAVEIEGVRWIADADTLAAAERMIVHMSLGALLRRDLHVVRLELSGGRGDLPAIRALMAAPTPETPPSSASRGFPRSGSVAPLPSVAVDELLLDVVALRTAEGSPPSRARLEGRLELRRGRTPHLVLREVVIDHPAAELTIGPGSVEIDPANGTAHAALPGRWRADWPFTVAAGSDGADAFTVEVSLPGEPPAAAAPGVFLTARVRRDETGVRTIDWKGTVRLPETGRLAEIAELTTAFAPLPAGERLELTLDGTVALSRGSRLAVQAGRFAMWDSLQAEVAVREGSVGIPVFRIHGPGLSVEGDWRISDGVHAGDVALVVEDTQWLAPYLPPRSLPDSLRIAATARAEGPLSDLQGGAAVEGWIRHGGAYAESLTVSVDGGLTGSAPLDFALALRASDLWVTTGGTLVGRDPFTAETSPVRVSAKRAPPAARTGRLQFDPDGPEFTAAGVRVTGELGEIRVDGSWSASEGGAATVDASWSSAPAPLVALIAPDGGAGSEIARRWAGGERPRVRAEARVDSSAAWAVDTRFQLPPPEVFALLLPPGVNLDGLAAVRGTLSARGRDSLLSARLDAGETEWLDEAVLELRRTGAGVAVDTLAVGLFGVDLRGSGSTDGNRVDSFLQLDLHSLDRLRRIVPDLPPDVDLAAAADVTLSGRIDAPDAAVELSVQSRGESWSAPGLVARVDVAAGRLDRLSARAVDTLRVGSLTLHRLSVDVRPVVDESDSAPFPLLAVVEAEGDSVGLAAAVAINRDAGWTAQIDTLATRWADLDLRSGGVARLGWDPVSRSGFVEGLRLAGGLGALELDGRLDAEDVRAVANVELRAGPWTEHVLPPEWPRPSEVRAELRVAGRDSLWLRAGATGFDFAPLPGARAELEASAGAQGVACTAALVDGERRVVTASLHRPERLDLLNPTRENGMGAWSAEAAAQGLPVPLRPDDPVVLQRFHGGDGSAAAQLDADVTFGGSGDQVTGELRGDLSFPRQPALRESRLHLDAALRPDAGLSARATWSRSGSITATADIALPELTVTPQAPPAFGDSLAVALRFDDWTLDELNPLLPAMIRIGGVLRSDLHAEGPPGDPRLRGWLDARAIALSSAKGDRARAEGRLELAGTLQGPDVSGRMELTQARLQIPEPPRALHAAEGSAMLWPDTLTAGAARPVKPAPEIAAEALDLGLDVVIPGSCWLRGRGLDVEMSGELSVVLHRGRPRVDGGLRAVRGTLSFVGNRFTVERGTATFYGTEEIDPDLDILLSRRRGDIRAMVRVTGRASAPNLELTSEPPMEEADILSHLLFDRAQTELDREQSGLLRTQAAAALRMFAIPGLERELGWRLGLDVVRLERREDEREAFSVVVGKYLSPRALLKYDQALDRGDDFAIKLEYWLSRHLLLETTSSRQNQSSVEMNWTRDY